MSKQQIRIDSLTESDTQWRVHLNSVQKHLDEHIIGEYFLNWIVIDKTIWDGRLPVIGASDVSQHRSAVPFRRFFRRHAPFVLNNAAGTLRVVQSGRELGHIVIL